MVVFDLQCQAGHRFEGWFEDLNDLKKQLKRGDLSCPVCGEDKVRQVPSGFAISRKGPGRERDDALAALGQAMVRHLREDYDNVGPEFANEALKIHYGASEPRNIRGVSTPDEEKMLEKEGVSFFKFTTVEQPAAKDDKGDDG